MIHIKFNKFSINKKEDIFTLNKIYFSLPFLHYIFFIFVSSSVSELFPTISLETFTTHLYFKPPDYFRKFFLPCIIIFLFIYIPLQNPYFNLAVKKLWRKKKIKWKTWSCINFSLLNYIYTILHKISNFLLIIFFATHLRGYKNILTTE